nr:hypothetical protein Itr_chr13CG10420 [Ipomoea trifida]
MVRSAAYDCVATRRSLTLARRMATPAASLWRILSGNPTFFFSPFCCVSLASGSTSSDGTAARMASDAGVFLGSGGDRGNGVGRDLAPSSQRAAITLFVGCCLNEEALSFFRHASIP